MGGCLSTAGSAADEGVVVKSAPLSREASSLLGGSSKRLGSLQGAADPQAAKAQAHLEEAKKIIDDELSTFAPPSAAVLASAQSNTRAAQDILAAMPDSKQLSQLKLDVAAADKVLDSAHAAAQQFAPAAQAIEAALSAGDGGRKLEKVLSTKAGGSKRELTRAASKVSEASAALSAAADSAMAGVGVSMDREGAAAKVAEAQVSLDEAMRAAPAEAQAELAEVKAALDKAASAAQAACA